MAKKLRALIVIRLSRQVEESTSAERQLEECARLCEQMGWEVVGVAEDLNVSAGSTTPFQRPELSKWIGDGKGDPGRPHEFDVLVFWRLDRLVRSMVQLADVMRWADEYDILLKSATEAHFDMSSQVGKIVASLVASFAEMELEAIRERIKADQHHRIRSGNYRGAVPAWGYMATDDPVRGKILVPDPEQVRQIEWATEQVLAGKPTQRVADEMNEAGELTPRDRHNVLMGRKPKGYKWRGNRLKDFLTSKTMLGYIVARDALTDDQGRPKKDTKGVTLYGEPYIITNDDGTPKLRAEPIMTREIYERISGALKERENQSHVTKRSNSLLLGVLHCGYCGAVAYRMAQAKGRRVRYRCRTRQFRDGQCPNPVATVDLEWVDGLVEEMVLDLMRDSYRREKIWHEGEDHSDEAIELEARLEELIPLLGTGPYKAGSRQYELLQGQITTVSERLEELDKAEIRPPSWTWADTDELFSDWWAGATVQEKNAYLRTAGVRVEYKNDLPRKRGDNPHINFIIEDVGAFHKDYGESDAIKNVKRLLEEVPAGHTVHLKNGSVVLEER